MGFLQPGLGPQSIQLAKDLGIEEVVDSVPLVGRNRSETELGSDMRAKGLLRVRQKRVC